MPVVTSAQGAADAERIHAARRFCYGFFAGLFIDCRSAGLAQAWPEVARLVSELDAIARDTEVTTAAVSPWPADEGEFAIEFARLFYGVGAATVPLAASCFSNDARLHCQGPYHAVREFYARVGKAPTEALGLPDDHLAVELAFVHALADDPGSLPVQREFVADHLLPWVPAFCDEVLAASAPEPIASMAIVLRRLVTADALLLPQLPRTA